MVRVRFAPSPTGELHLGGARTALFNLLYARANGGKFILRIDDTDQERSRPEYTKGLLTSLRWLGLEWDEGPYYQSARIKEYQEEAQRLLENRLAYRCYCTPAELEAGRLAAAREKRPFRYPGSCRNLTEQQEEAYRAQGRKPVLRLRVPDEGNTVVRDMVRGEVVFENQILDDFIIIKSSGLPTYNFASVVDDERLKITDVIRAEEHLSNTPRQQLCALALGYRLPVYAHLPMILAPDRSKLSKRHGATAVEEFRELGYLPEALVNYMCLLGWSPGEEEIITLEEAVSKFSLAQVNKTAAVYDMPKLTWFNGHYQKKAEPDRIARLAIPFFQKEGLLKAPVQGAEFDYLLQVVTVVRDRVKTLLELAQASDYFYRDDFAYDEKGAARHFTGPETAGLLRRVARKLSCLASFDPLLIETGYAELGGELDIPAGRLISPSRLAVSGRTMGPELSEIMAVLGREKVLARLERAACHTGGK